MPSAEFEAAILAIERPQTYALDGPANGCGNQSISFQNILQIK
jgi:hypothetical protein